MFNKLCTYKLFKLEFTFEAYLPCVSNIKHRTFVDLDVLLTN